MIPLDKPCICGKTWVHCKRCGSTSVYALRGESRTESAKAGFLVEVYNCKVCPHKTLSSEPCKAWTGAQQEDHRKITKLVDQEVEIEPGVDLSKLKQVLDSKDIPVSSVEPPGQPMTLADLINRKEPSPEDGSEQP